MKTRTQDWLKLVSSIGLLILLFVILGNTLKAYETKQDTVEVTVSYSEETKRGTTEWHHIIENGEFKSVSLITTETIYKVYFVIDGEKYYVLRNEPYEVGQTISVDRMVTYNGDEIITSEYR